MKKYNHETKKLFRVFNSIQTTLDNARLQGILIITERLAAQEITIKQAQDKIKEYFK